MRLSAQRLVRVARGIAVAAVAFLPLATQASTLRIGLFGLPSHQGNPYALAGMPDILTHSAIFDGLTRIDAKGEVHPWLAESWENIDPLTWVVHLRPDVRFSNGAPFTASAVVNAIDYLTSPAAASEGVAVELNFLKSARAIDDLTVSILTKVPSPMLPRYLPILHMVEPDAWRKLGPEGFSRAPIGTGPYQVTRWTSNLVSLNAFKDSWRRPVADTLEIRAVPDSAARVQALLSGQIDVAHNLGPDDKAQVEAAGGRFVSWPTQEVRVVSFITTTHASPLRNVLVRRALNFAVDRPALIAALLANAVTPASQGATRGSFGYDPSLKPFAYNPTEAKRLLKEAGYPNGFSFATEIVSGSTANDTAIIQGIAAYLAKVGVTMNIHQLPIQEFLRNTATGTWPEDAFMMVFPVVPPVDALRPLRLHSCLRPAPWFCDRSIMPALEQAFSEFDPAKQVAERHALMAWERDQAMALFLWEDARFGGVAKGVENFEEVNGFIDYDRIKPAR